MKITGDCPHCKKEVAIDIDKLEMKTAEIPNASVTGQQTQQIVKTEPEAVEKVIEKKVIEDFKPNYECPDGNCDIGIHKNKNYKTKAKGKCTNCSQFTKYDKGKCPWCKNEIEPLEPEELEELGIDNPTIEEHEEHEHE